MLKHIVKPFLLCLPFIIIIFSLELGLRKVPTNYSFKKEALESHEDSINTLILGSSHAFHGINPRYFRKPTFNLAYASQSLYYDSALLSKYINKLPNLKTVFLEVSYFSLEYSLMDIEEDWRSMFYYNAYGIPTERNKLDWDIRKFSLIQLYKKDQVIQYIFSGFKNPEITMSSNGWDALGSGGSCITGESRAIFHTSIMNAFNIDENSSYIEQIAVMLKKRGIKLILISPPVCNSYFKNMDSEKYLSNQKRLKYLSNKFRVEYFNYMNDQTYKDEDFIDSDHLSIVGAKKFTQILNQKIK